MNQLVMVLMPSPPAAPGLPFDPPLPLDHRDKVAFSGLFPTNLDTCGFAVDQPFTPAASTCVTRFAHAKELENWLEIACAMTETDLGLSYATVSNLNACGSRAWIQFSPSRSKHRCRVKQCGLLVCPTCGPREARKMADRISEWIGPVKQHSWRMFTLSLPSSGSHLLDQIEQLRKAFRRLRQARVWCDTQTYGLSICEVTYNATADTWHPHLHVLMRGKWSPIRIMRDAWWKASGAQARIHVREVDSAKGASLYVAKYLGKSTKITEVHENEVRDRADQSYASMPKARLQEMIIARCKKRWLLLVGEGPPLPDFSAEALPDQGPNDWQPVCSLTELFRRGAHDPLALSIAIELGMTWDIPDP